jgi:hypothetical protein
MEKKITIFIGLLSSVFLSFMFIPRNSTMELAQDPVRRATFAEYSNSPNPLLSDPASSICSTINSENSTLRIESLFTVNALRDWINVFQTDDSNWGMRLEIDREGDTALLIPVSEELVTGIVFKKETLRVGVENHFLAEITLNKMVGIKAQLNGELQIKRFPFSKIGCNRPLNGGGFSSDRTIDGKSVTQISLVEPVDKKFFGIALGTNQLLSKVVLVSLFLVLLIALTRREANS